MKGMVFLCLALLGTIIFFGVRSENAKIDNCREAGGSMIGQICVIRIDRTCVE